MIGLLLAATLVTIDVGHTPTSPGVVSASGIGEHVYNRDMAMRVEKWLNQGRIETQRTAPVRGNDLIGRSRAANGSKLLVSIHHDSAQEQFKAQPERFTGFSIFISGRNRQYGSSLACAKSVAKALIEGGYHPSTHHREKVAGEGYELVDARGIYRRDGLAVLSNTTAPAILVEAAVIINPIEERWRARPEVAEALAAKIAAGIRHCLK